MNLKEEIDCNFYLGLEWRYSYNRSNLTRRLLTYDSSQLGIQLNKIE